MRWYVESDGGGIAVRSGLCGSLSGDQGLIIFEYTIVRSIVSGSVSGDRASDMSSYVCVEPR